MAKNKAPLTPEQAEIKAMKKEKSAQGFIKFVAVVLALVLTIGVVFAGKTAADKALEAAGSNVQVGDNGGDDFGGDDFGGDDFGGDDFGGDETTDDPAGEDAPAGDDAPAGEDAPAGDNNATTSFTKANAHENFNKWTAAAAKGNYKFARVCAYTADGKIDVGNATGTLNKIIQGIDENSSLDSVVGGFLGIGNTEGQAKNGALVGDVKKQYALKAMSLTAADIKDASVSGNKYTIKLGNFSNPQKDGKNAMSRATNDFFTHQEVVDGIAGFTTAIKVSSTDIQYTNVTITATVDGGNLKSLEINYGFSAKMALKAIVTINGSGKATNKMVYTIG